LAFRVATKLLLMSSRIEYAAPAPPQRAQWSPGFRAFGIG
jgi:hypothetical protein